MAMRITTNGVFRGYRSDLQNSYSKLNKSMTRVTTQRNFGAYAEDVSAASRAFQLRRSHWRADTQVNNSNYVVSKFETAWSAVDYIVDGEGAEDNLNGIVESLRGLNSPTGSARVTLGESIMAKAESIVRLLNTQYGDQFIFAGADGRNVPFAWGKNDDGSVYLTYRGIDVSTPVPIMSAEKLKEHMVVKYVEKPDVTDSDETLNLDDIAQIVGEQYRPAGTNYSMKYENGEFTLEWTNLNNEQKSKTMTEEEVLGYLGKPAEVTEDGKTTTYSYAFGEPDVNGDLTLTTTAATTKGVWEIGFDDGLTGQDFTLKLPDGFNNEFPDEEWAKTELAKLFENEDYLQAAFDDYKAQFDENYVSYTHEVDGNGNPIGSAYENYQKLLAMSQEATYVDIGLGVDWNETGDLIPSSAYNSALNGLSFIGFGSTIGEDGELRSNNLAMLMYEMGTVLKACDETTGTWPEGWGTERVSALTKAIESSVNGVTVEHIRLSNNANYLQTNLTQLKAQRDNLNAQILDIEQIDPADAITEYMYARYAYNAALSVGSSILTNTLLDYLR